MRKLVVWRLCWLHSNSDGYFGDISWNPQMISEN